MLAPFRLQAHFPFAMSNDTTASLQAQAQAVLTSKGSRPLALFLLGKSVQTQCGLSIELMGDSLHLMESADELQALIEATSVKRVSKADLAEYMEESDRLARPYVEEMQEELRIMESEFRKEMGL